MEVVIKQFTSKNNSCSDCKSNELKYETFRLASGDRLCFGCLNGSELAVDGKKCNFCDLEENDSGSVFCFKADPPEIFICFNCIFNYTSSED